MINRALQRRLEPANIILSYLPAARLFSAAEGIKTPLYDLHVKMGGQIVPFAGTYRLIDI